MSFLRHRSTPPLALTAAPALLLGTASCRGGAGERFERPESTGCAGRSA